MRLTIFLLTAAFLNVSATGVSQTISFSGTNVSLKKVFSEVKKQTGYVFTYTDNILAGTTTVSIRARDLSLPQFLDQVFANQPIAYTIEFKTIFLFRRITPELFAPPVPAPDQAPPIIVRGRIVSEEGAPLAGASIMVKGGKTATTTDADGGFSINAEEGHILRISYVGYQEKMVKVGPAGNGIMVITLLRSEAALNDVTVSTGYWSTTKKLSTGNISKVTSKEIERQPVTNPLQAMQGRMPGIYINQSTGLPGSGFQVRIRGVNSLNNGNDPLYVVDGVPFLSTSMSNDNTSGALYQSGVNAQGISPLNSINPNDIESIEVLKDADATAIYGSRGANGVVLITTKKGRPGKAKIDLNARSGISEVLHKIQLMNTRQYVAMRMEAVANDGNGIQPGEYDINGKWDQSRSTDWQEVLIGGKAKMTDINASISGGNNETRFLFGMGYNDQGTVFPGDNTAGRYSTHFSVSHISADKKFTTNLSTSYSYGKNNIVSSDLTGIATTLAPDAPRLYGDDGKLNWEGSTWSNPVAQLGNRFNSNTYNLLTNLELGYEVLKSVRLKTTVGLNDIRNEERNTFSSDTYNPAYGMTSDNSSLSTATGTRRSWIVEPQLTWDSKAGKGKLALLLGGTYQYQVSESQQNYYNGFPSNELINNPQAAVRATLNAYAYNQYHYAALYGRINYNWDDRYIVNLTGRRDGSSRF
ncbi:MAG TPA: SusC/RagA family TonB-linked outer membrane protein, partial [Puia sp.]